MNYLSVSDLEAQGKSSIWVINNTEVLGIAKGTINFTVFGAANGRATAVQIPVTNIPVDATTQATFASIVESPDFRRLVVQQMLLVVSETDARKLLSTPDAQKEQARVYSVLKNAVPFSPSAPADAVAMAGESDDGINPVALMVANSTDDDAKSTDDQIRNMEMNKSILTAADLKYIAAKSANAKVKQKAAEILTARNV